MLCVDGIGQISVEEGGEQLPQLGLCLAQMHLLGKHLVVVWMALQQLLLLLVYPGLGDHVVVHGPDHLLLSGVHGPGGDGGDGGAAVPVDGWQD